MRSTPGDGQCWTNISFTCTRKRDSSTPNQQLRESVRSITHTALRLTTVFTIFSHLCITSVTTNRKQLGRGAQFLVSPSLSHLLDDILASYILDDSGGGRACGRTARRAGYRLYSRTGSCRQCCHSDARLSCHGASWSLHLHWAGLSFYRQSHHSLQKDTEAAYEQTIAILTITLLSRALACKICGLFTVVHNLMVPHK